MKEKILYLHIGSHKTGTTSIQSALHDNKELLSKYGLSHFDELIPGIKNNFFTKGSANSWINCFNRDDLLNGCEIVHKELFAKKLSKLEGNVITSTEKLFFVFNPKEIHQLKKELDKFFNRIIIISYLRRQDRQIISHYQGTTNYSNHFANKFFGMEAKALPIYQKQFDLYYDYNKKIEMWSEIFGQNNIIIRCYDEIKNKDSVEDFFNIFNIKLPSPKNLNISRGFEQVKVGHILNSKLIPQNNHIRFNLVKSLENKSKLIPSRENAQSFYENYKKSNQLLNKKYKITKNEFLFDDDFSKYPEQSEDEWNEKKANDVISNIIEGIYKSYGQIDLNILVNSAIKLEKIDLKLSYNLLVTVQNLIPENQFINQKINQYRIILNK